MKKTVLVKSLSGFLVVISLFTIFLLFFVFKTVRNFYIDSLAENLQDLNQSLTPTIGRLLKEGRFGELNSTVRLLGRGTGVRITVVLPSGQVVTDSEKDPALMENHLSRLEIARALQGEPYRSLRASNTLGEEMLYVSLPLTADGKILAVIRTSIWLKEVDRLLNRIQKKVTLFACILLAAAFFFSGISARGTARIVRNLKTGFQGLARGEFHTRILLKDRGELRELADSFNAMADRVQALFASSSRRSEELNGIIHAMQEGLGLFDRDGRLVLSNFSFNNLLAGGTEPRGRFYWELLGETAFVVMMEEVRCQKKGLTRELVLGNRTLLCSAAPVTAKEETVVVLLHDITDIKNLERIKKDFISDVSHELRTPLTAIKGYAETLECPDDKNRHYVEIIKSHTDRLINIVNDLIALSELEESTAGIQKEPVNLAALVTDVLEIFKPRLREKNLNFSLKVDKASRVSGDPFKLTQVLINLLDNAIRYTDQGKIEVEIKDAGKYVQTKVKDTGIGISSEHLDRIFERFYVADKSRSRKSGGTGLGLAIVKHIVQLHEGQITVQSTPGTGTEFTILLPIFADR